MRWRFLIFFIPILIISTLYFSFNRIKRLSSFHLGVENLSDLTQIRIGLKSTAKDVKFLGDGLSLAGTLFLSKNQHLPGIIFLHGSSVKGRRLAFYLLLCKRLSELGYHVLSIDMRGFGDSEDPTVVDAVESWESSGDIGNAVDFLISKTRVDTQQIFIVGHSAGANQAIIAGVKDPRIKKIVAIGPSRRVQERVLSKEATNRQYFIERFSRDRELNEVLSWQTYRQIAIKEMIDSHLSYFQVEGHKPILLVDGSRENPADLEFLNTIYQKMIAPKSYVTISGSNHYANVKEFGPFIFYHKQVFESLVNEIDHWLKSPSF